MLVLGSLRNTVVSLLDELHMVDLQHPYLTLLDGMQTTLEFIIYIVPVISWTA